MAFPSVKGEYVMSFSNNRKQIGEYSVLLPNPPKDKDFVNYGKSIDKQKFQRLEIPADLKTVSQRAQEDYVNRMWHKRTHGEWWLIRDTPIFICGLNWYYLNIWWCDAECHPQFRVCDIDHFQFWRFEVVNDPNCYGAVVIKSRQEGMTEKALSEGYEYVTRVRGKHFGMQSLSKDSVEEDYLRVLKAHAKIPFFFKPVNKGSDKPTDGIRFEAPSERITKSRIEAEWGMDIQLEKNFQPLNSRISFEPAVIDKYDGATKLHRYRQGEFGKTPVSTMNILERLGRIRPCLHLFNGQKIVGKMLWESTVEEFADGETLELVSKLWTACDPKNLVNGRTLSGMKRLFRNALDTAEPDDFGFPQKEKTRKFLEGHFARLEKLQDWDELSREQRKNPITLAHALTPSTDNCLFNALKLKRRLDQLQNNIFWNGESVDNLGRPVTDVRRRGNFFWITKDAKVGFEDDPNGKFWVSHLLPADQANKVSFDMGLKAPGNKHLFGCGIDPIDTAMPDGTKQSSPAMCLFRKPDYSIDSACANDKSVWEQKGMWKTPGNMETGQPWVTYCERSEEASEFYEDMIMCAFYYGTEVLYERNKGAGIREYFRNRGYWTYLSFRPLSTLGQYTTDKEPGLPASPGSIEQYISGLKGYVALFIDNCKHSELIHDGDVGLLTLRNTPKSRQKHDLAIAFGLALLHAEQPYEKPAEVNPKEDNSWFTAVDVMSAN